MELIKSKKSSKEKIIKAISKNWIAKNDFKVISIIKIVIVFIRKILSLVGKHVSFSPSKFVFTFHVPVRKNMYNKKWNL